MAGGISELKVLVVEDNPQMRVILRTVLRAVGIRDVLETGGVLDAIEIASTLNPDIALVDQELEDGQGVEFVRWVRGLEPPGNRFMGIVMVTAYAHRRGVLQAINSGVDEVLVKPVSAEMIAKRIDAVINAQRPYVNAPNYFGPDRRRYNDPKFKGPFRRTTDLPEDDADMIL